VGAGAGGESGGTPSVVFGICGDLGISGINDIQYLADGSAVVLGLAGGVAKIVDPMTGAEKRWFFGHTGAVNAVAVSTDGTTLATASDDHTVRLFRVADAAPLATLTAGSSPLLSVAITADSKHVVAGAADGTVYLWDAGKTLPLARKAGHSDEVLGVGFAAAEARVFSASKDGSVRIWSADDLTSLGAALTGGTWQTALDVSPDGTRVAVGDVYNSVRLISAAGGNVERTLSVGISRVWKLDFAPDGATVFASVDSVYSVPVDGSAGKIIAAPIGNVPRATASPTDDALFVASEWIMEYRTREGDSLRDEIHEGPFARGVAFAPSGAELAIGGDFGFVVHAAPNGAVTAAPDFDQAVPLVEGLGFSPDGTRLVTGDGDGHIKLWATSGWQSQMDIDTYSRGVHSTLFSPDGTRFVAAGYDGVHDVYDAASGTLIRGIGLVGKDNHQARFSPDGAFAAVGTDDGGLSLVRTSDWADILQLPDAHDDAVTVAFSRDGRLFSAGDHRVTAWETTGSTTRQDLLADDAFASTTLEASPDGTVLVAGAYTGELKLWTLPQAPPSNDGGAGQAGAGPIAPPAPLPAPPIPGHGSPVLGTSFSSDSRMLAVAYTDGTVQVWCR
jgi:WD40 repeat protein